jgi:hypothetical protein
LDDAVWEHLAAAFNVEPSLGLAGRHNTHARLLIAGPGNADGVGVIRPVVEDIERRGAETPSEVSKGF